MTDAIGKAKYNVLNLVIYAAADFEGFSLRIRRKIVKVRLEQPEGL